MQTPTLELWGVTPRASPFKMIANGLVWGVGALGTSDTERGRADGLADMPLDLPTAF